MKAIESALLVQFFVLHVKTSTQKRFRIAVFHNASRSKFESVPFVTERALLQETRVALAARQVKTPDVAKCFDVRMLSKRHQR